MGQLPEARISDMYKQLFLSKTPASGAKVVT